MDLVDLIVTADYGARGVVSKLYEAAEAAMGSPLCRRAAEAMRRHLDASGSVLIATGFRVSRYGGVYETDGVVSSIIFAEALARHFRADVGVMVDEGYGRVLQDIARDAGMQPIRVFEIPLDRNLDSRAFEELIRMLNPSIAVAVERPSANEKCVYHNSRGEDITHLHARVDVLLEKLRDGGVELIGVGDGGNEVGMAVVRKAVEESVPYGRLCRCGCGGGIAASTPCDHIVVSSVSDLGVYGLLTHLLDGSVLSRMGGWVESVMDSAISRGCVDAVMGPGFVGVDGVDIHSVKAILGLLAKTAGR